MYRSHLCSNRWCVPVKCHGLTLLQHYAIHAVVTIVTLYSGSHDITPDTQQHADIRNDIRRLRLVKRVLFALCTRQMRVQISSLSRLACVQATGEKQQAILKK